MKNSTSKKNITKEFDLVDIEYEVETKTVYKPVSLTNQLPTLPIATFAQIASWLRDVSAKKQCEGICSLTVVDGAWKVIVWHQEAPCSLHVKFDESSEENQALLCDKTKEALKAVHCTIHSHHTAAASQSGDDVSDEKGKNGWHVTIGNCQSSELSLHTRFNVRRNAVFGTKGKNKGKKIQDAHQEFIVTDIDSILEEVASTLPTEYIRPVNEIAAKIGTVPYPEEWLERVEKTTYQPSIGLNNYHSSYQQYKKKTGTTSNGKPAACFSEIKLPLDPAWQFCQALHVEYHSNYKEYSDYAVDITCLRIVDMFKICKTARKIAIKECSAVTGKTKKEINKLMPEAEDVAMELDAMYDPWDIDNDDRTTDANRHAIRKLYKILSTPLVTNDYSGCSQPAS